MTFETLGLNPEILKSIKALGFETPTRVQREAIPKVLEGKDLIVMAKTGSGKTGAFSLPIIQGVEENQKTQALILAPTRELAVQVEMDLREMAVHSNVHSTAVYGQHNINTEIKHLNKGKEIVVGTPGRVLHHIQEKTLKTGDIKYLVLDEADRMLDMGFIEQMVKIIKRLPKERVTLLFSATMPDEIQRMCKSYMIEPETIALDSDTKTVDTIEQGYYRVEKNEKRTQLRRILTVEKPMSCMIFCNTRIEVDKVNDFLTRKGFLSEAIHGANTQNKRMRTIDEFKRGDIQILVATDVAARGIHVDDLQLVINYDVPMDKDNYIHRVGRTGRAGNGGHAVTLVTGDDLYTFYEVEEHAGSRIDELDLPTEEAYELAAKEVSDHWEQKKAERLKKREAHKPKKQDQPKKHGQRKPQQKRQGQSRTQKSHANKPQHGHKPQQGQKTNRGHKGSQDHKSRRPQDHAGHKQHAVKPVQKPVERPVTKAAPPVQTPQKTKKKFSLKNLFKKKA